MFGQMSRSKSEQKEMGEGMAKNEENYKGIIENIGDFIFRADPHTFKAFYVNPAVKAFFGYERDEWLANPSLFPASIHTDDRESVLKQIKKSVELKKDGKLSFRIMSKDGSTKWVESHYFFEKNADGDVAVVNGVLTDATERKKAEELLRESENKFRNLFDSSPDCIKLMDKNGKLILLSKGGREEHGFKSEAEILNWDYLGTVTEEFVPKIREALDRAAQGSTVSLDVQHRQEQNVLGRSNREWCNMTFSPLQNAQGAIENILVISRDITARKKIENELSFKTAILTAESEASIDGILAIDAERKILSVNKRFGELWNIPDEILATKDDKTMLQLVITQLKDPKEFINKVEYLYGRPDEKSRDAIEFKDGRAFDRYSSPLVDSNGGHYGRIWFFRDISRERELDRAKTEFVALASHQLRTPITAIKGYTEMLLDGDAGELNAKQEGYLKQVEHGGKRMLELITALLNVSRIDLGTFVVEPRLVSFNEVAEDVLNELALTIKSKELRMEKLFDSSLPPVNADPQLLRIVFQNFLSNAVKYTPKGGLIKISIEKKNDGVLISVADTGCGIPEKAKSKIFTKLFRADNAWQIDADGTGLGLYVVKAIAEASGGKVWFESVENKGTAFHFEVPLTGMKRREGTKGLQ